MSPRNLVRIIKGTMTFVPGLYPLFQKELSGTDNARQCYAQWMRHLVMAHRNGLSEFPRRVAEFGPGASLGVGIAALISGVQEYLALDIVRHANTTENLRVFDDLVDLYTFRRGVVVPTDGSYQSIRPDAKNGDFPREILSDEQLREALSETRLKQIRRSIQYPDQPDSMIKYRVPWTDAASLGGDKVQFIYSDAVLEHVDDLAGAYSAMAALLATGGLMSHAIDYKCHGTADEWYGHWKYSDLTWCLIRGKRPYMINRVPHSGQMELMTKAGFRVIQEIRLLSTASLPEGASLASRFQELTENDLRTSSTFVQAVKNGAAKP